ncbi:phosphomannomutase/phosphoglucomutase [bacterium]|nr:phosphomannomutase/phosphoglucomutase [bacterium]
MAIINKLSAFGKNDIRGIYSEDITEELFYYVGRAFARYVRERTGLERNELWISIARDTRLHSPSLMSVVIKGLQHAGANVVVLGMTPTPLAYYSEFIKIPYKDEEIKVNASMMVTASHNPSEYNGLKMTCQRASLTEADIQRVKEITVEELNAQTQFGNHGMKIEFDIVKHYLENTAKYFEQTGTGIKVVVDSANATAGIIAPQLYRELGCEVVELFSEPDGNFPNHHPNPSDEKTLDAIKKKVKEEKADVGIAFDGDSDRIGVIDNEGNYLTGDRLLYIYASDIVPELVKRGEKPAVVSEVKCSQVLFDSIDEMGGNAVMCKTGHGYIKSKMKETNAILAGEMSGHMFFKDRYYGFDDAIYAGCRIIEIIAKNKAQNKDFRLSDLLEPFKKVYTTSEVRYKCPNDLKDAVLYELNEKINKNEIDFGKKIKDIITIDGLRIVFDNGFALIRKSNTEPVFTLRFEADTKESAEGFKDAMISALDECIKDNEQD